MRRTFPRGSDLLVSWRLVDTEGNPVDLSSGECTLTCMCQGSRTVADTSAISFTPGMLTWFFPASEQHSEGVYGLRLDMDGRTVVHPWAFSLTDDLEHVAPTHEITITDIIW